MVDASIDALKKVEQGKEFPAEAKEALEQVIQMIKGTMFETLDNLHKDDQTLVDTYHGEVSGCNSDMTHRWDTEIVPAQKEAEKLRREEADLAQQVSNLESENTTKHAELRALMTNKREPELCDEFPSMPVEQLWEGYYKTVAEYAVTAAAEATTLQQRRLERNTIVDKLTSKVADHVAKSAALTQSFCDWKRNILGACSTHDTCYTDKSALFKGQVQFFVDARDKRIAAYRSALKLIDDLNKMMIEDPQLQVDDAETRFPPNNKDVPQKADCDSDVLDDWNAALYECPATGGPGKD